MLLLASLIDPFSITFGGNLCAKKIPPLQILILEFAIDLSSLQNWFNMFWQYAASDRVNAFNLVK